MPVTPAASVEGSRRKLDVHLCDPERPADRLKDGLAAIGLHPTQGLHGEKVQAQQPQNENSRGDRLIND